MSPADDDVATQGPADERIVCHLDVGDDGQRAVDLLAAGTGLSRQAVKQAMHKGAVWLSRRQHGRPSTQRLRRGDRVVNAGEALDLYYDPELLASEPPRATLLADEQVYSVWYKPFGMLSQGSKWGDHFTLTRWAEIHLQPQRPAFLVHRLDRAATGLMLVAHRRRTAAALAALFRERRVDKTYTAVVEGRAETAIRIDTPIDGRPARSHVRCLDYDPQLARSLVEIDIETGRKHQIRRHLAGVGLPIVGDRLYGQASPGAGEDLQLAASRLAFRSPDNDGPREYTLPVELLPGLR